MSIVQAGEVWVLAIPPPALSLHPLITISPKNPSLEPPAIRVVPVAKALKSHDSIVRSIRSASVSADVSKNRVMLVNVPAMVQPRNVNLLPPKPIPTFWLLKLNVQLSNQKPCGVGAFEEKNSNGGLDVLVVVNVQFLNLQ